MRGQILRQATGFVLGFVLGFALLLDRHHKSAVDRIIVDFTKIERYAIEYGYPTPASRSVQRRSYPDSFKMVCDSQAQVLMFYR